MADERLERAKRTPSNVIIGLIVPEGKGVTVEGRGARARTPAELGRGKDVEGIEQ